MTEIDFIPEIGSKFSDRLAQQYGPRSFSMAIRSGTIRWDQTSGDYSTDLWHPGHPSSIFQWHESDSNIQPPTGTNYLVGIEKTISLVIENKLSTLTKPPIICLDVGGRVGTTWCRLAHKFKNEIKSGTLRLVVSNLEPNKANKSNSNQTSDPIIDDGKQYVEFISAEALEFRGLKLSDGTSLRGNTSILHERQAISAHSRIPEWHIPRLIELIAPDGIYYCQDATVSPMYDKGDQSIRGRALEVACNNITSARRVTEVYYNQNLRRIRGVLFHRSTSTTFEDLLHSDK